MPATTITVVVGLLALIGTSFAAVGYVERSSSAAFAEFMTANTSQASELDHSGANGKRGCPVGKRELPTQITPLP
jgi:hypothetical protein